MRRTEIVDGAGAREHSELVLVDYAGAGARLEVEKALALDPRRWAYMPKLDGCYAKITTDGAGRIADLVARSGASLAAQAPDLIGIATGLPDAALAAELEAHTEAAARARATRGYALAHVFDITRWRGCDVGGEPFEARYALLHRWQTLAELDGVARAPAMTPDTRTFTWAMPTDGATAPAPRERRWHPPGTMRAGGPPRDLRRLPIVPLHRGRAAAEQLWRAVARDGLEGMVAVRLDAPLRTPNSKRKVKKTDTLDALVVDAGGGAAVLTWRGHIFTVSARSKVGATLARGDVVELAHDGFHEGVRVAPRFARIIRRRDDLRPAEAPPRAR